MSANVNDNLGDIAVNAPMGYPRVFAAKNRSDEIRKQSSSGGMFYALAEQVIENNRGTVYGCAFDDGLHARHIRCETLEEIKRCMGSKYSQSDMGTIISEVIADLKEGRTVLFTGTPCQVDAVSRACSSIKNGTLLTADLICHGVPSPGIFEEHIRFLEATRKQRVALYAHRPKDLGWGHTEKIIWEDGTEEQGSRLSDSWKRVFYFNQMLRPSCYVCPYTTIQRHSDVTIADFWGIEQSSAAEMKDDLGVSLLLVNTDRGLELVENSNIDKTPVSIDEATPKNPMLLHPSVCNRDKDQPWKILYESGYADMLRK